MSAAYVLGTDRPSAGDDTVTHCKLCLRVIFVPLEFLLSRDMEDKRPILCCDCANVRGEKPKES